MADDHKLNLEENSKYRVAYDLMNRIATSGGDAQKKSDTREYYMTLYHQCFQVVFREKTFDEVKDPQDDTPEIAY